MRFQQRLAVGLALAMPVLFFHAQVQADWPISNLLHHRHGDCDVKQSVVRLPAQEIRIETSQPRVIVNQGAGYSRMRGGYFAGSNAAYMPVVQGPFFATVLPMQGMTLNGAAPAPVGSPMLDAIHAMENQHLQFAKSAAGMQKEIELTNQAAQRVSERLAATVKGANSGSADPTSVQSQLDTMSKRLDAIERLLIIHDNALKTVVPKN